MKKTKPPQPSLCHFCAKPIPESPRVNNGKKFMRKIIFCDMRCFNSYLAANRPLIKIDNTVSKDIAQRATARLDDIKAEVLFSTPDCKKTLISEEIIYELTTIIEGTERVTKGERYECMSELRSAQRPARLRI